MLNWAQVLLLEKPVLALPDPQNPELLGGEPWRSLTQSRDTGPGGFGNFGGSISWFCGRGGSSAVIFVL